MHRVLGYPGDGINGVFGALNRADGKLQFDQARHEKMGAFMASAYAKFARELGVCIATSHLMTGLYDALLDHNGDAWTGSMLTDRIARLDTRNGQYTEYMLPRSTNIRRVYVDDSKNPGALWVGNNHGASIVKVEPLD